MWGRKREQDLVDTPQMAAFFDMLAHLNAVQFLAMRAAWHALDRKSHEDAWATVRAVGARDGLTRSIDRVRSEARSWAIRGSSSYPYATTNNDITSQQLRMEACEAIVDAALAVALGNRLDPESHDILIEPLLSATEPF